MDRYLDEILEQPAAVERLYERFSQDARFSELGRAYRANPKPLLFLGMGSSNYAPMAIRSRLSGARIPFKIVEAGEFLHFELESAGADTWVIAVSQSGESIETRLAIEQLKGKVSKIIAITNEADSSLAHLADSTVLLHAGSEIGSTTKTFVNTALALNLLVNELTGHPTVSREMVDGLATAFQTSTQYLREKTREIISFLRISEASYPDPIHFIARGETLATASQAALILAETTDLFTQALAGGSFRHGPYELAGPLHRAVVFAPSGKTQRLLINVANELCNLGSRVVLISDTTETGAFHKLQMPPIAPELAPLLYFLPIELFGWNVARTRGRTPGMLRHMGKVTTVE